jgi:hypothetical protein
MKLGRKPEPPRGQHVELRHGSWDVVLNDVTADTLICDPPYSAQTQEGHAAAGPGVLSDAAKNKYGSNQVTYNTMSYAHWGPSDVHAFVEFWAPRTVGWMAVMTDDRLAPCFRDAYEKVGRYAFAPVPIIQQRPRLVGDGPGSCAVYLMVSRPRTARFSTWGALPGVYLSATDKTTQIVSGAKPLSLMRKIVCDYSRVGDVVCDPCAGGATTLIAARIERRSAYGAEQDLATYKLAQNRLAGRHRLSPLQEALRFEDW